MKINLATQKFREDLTSLINNSGLPICNMCMILNEAKSAMDSLLVSAIQAELQDEERSETVDEQSVQPDCMGE